MILCGNYGPPGRNWSIPSVPLCNAGNGEDLYSVQELKVINKILMCSVYKHSERKITCSFSVNLSRCSLKCSRIILAFIFMKVESTPPSPLLHARQMRFTKILTAFPVYYSNYFCVNGGAPIWKPLSYYCRLQFEPLKTFAELVDFWLDFRFTLWYGYFEKSLVYHEQYWILLLFQPLIT